MKYSTRETRFQTRRSIAESLVEALTEGGLRPAAPRPAATPRRRYGRGTAIAAAFLATAALGFAFLRPRTEPAVAAPVAVAEVVLGDVRVLPASPRPRPSSLLTLAAGEAIAAGAVIETADATDAPAAGRQPPTGRASFRLSGGQSLRLDAGSRVRVVSGTEVVLERGAVYVDSEGGEAVEVRTTLGVVRDVGTQFEVRLVEDPDAEAGAEPTLQVRVREGAVELETGGETHRATAGEELALAADGALERGTASVHGSHWDWVLEIAPAFDATGRPLRAFLDWLARESGWEIRFADPDTAAAADTNILEGDVRDLTPAEASRMVLDSSGLEYALEDGVLTVAPKPD